MYPLGTDGTGGIAGETVAQWTHHSPLTVPPTLFEVHMVVVLVVVVVIVTVVVIVAQWAHHSTLPVPPYPL